MKRYIRSMATLFLTGSAETSASGLIINATFDISITGNAKWCGHDDGHQPRTLDEPRTILIGKIGLQFWTAITTPRGDRIRIISVRRSRDEERELHES